MADPRREPLINEKDRQNLEPQLSCPSVLSSASSCPDVISPPFRQRGQASLYGDPAAIQVTDTAAEPPPDVPQKNNSNQKSMFSSIFKRDRDGRREGNSGVGSLICAHPQIDEGMEGEPPSFEMTVKKPVGSQDKETSSQTVAQHKLAEHPSYTRNYASRSKKSSSMLLPTLDEDRTADPVDADVGLSNPSQLEANKDQISTKIPADEGLWGVFNRMKTHFVGPLILIPIFFFLAFAMIYGSSKQLGYEFDIARVFEHIDWDREINVAFVGNAYLFVNDVPRVVEALSENHIYQDSVIHPGGSLRSLLRTGNGMYKAWRTEAADIGGVYYEDYGGYTSMYDYGACSVKQLLKGYDDYMGYGNPYGVYANDGLNPCIRDEYYGNFVADEMSANPVEWDYVVLVDQTKRIAVEWGRNDTLKRLSKYGKLLNATTAIPVIIAPHAFNSSKTNMTGLGNIPTFTARLHKGIKEYVKTLAQALPSTQKPIVAPVDLAYLTVYEEDPDLFKALFVKDQMHSSLVGTYLISCVLYMSLFGHRLPDSEALRPDGVAELFSRSRKLVGSSTVYPSSEETYYLRSVARRVVLKGYVPSSFKEALKAEQAAAEKASGENRRSRR